MGVGSVLKLETKSDPMTDPKTYNEKVCSYNNLKFNRMDLNISLETSPVVKVLFQCHG